MGRNVLIALDRSASSQKAFDWALEHVIQQDDRVTLLFVHNAKPIGLLNSIPRKIQNIENE
jgi:nucleotide-binding universal stress UspA family protein